MIEQLKKEDFKDCVLIIFRGDANNWRAFCRLVTTGKLEATPGTPFIHLEKGESIEMLTEEKLNRFGWYKK